MSPVAFAGVLAVALGVLAVVLNHCHARLALVELTLNEGLPPGYAIESQTASTATPTATVDPGSLVDAELLSAGVHVFLSRNCHACQRLLEELELAPLAVDSEMYLHYVDRPRPLATAAAAQQGAHLTEYEAELAASVGADPLPYTIALGPHGLAAAQVSPAAKQIVETAHNAGIGARVTR